MTRSDAPAISARIRKSDDPQASPNVRFQALERMLSIYDTLLDRHMPPAVLVDQNRCVVETFSAVERFFRFGSRRPFADVLELLIDSLQEPAADALGRCIAGQHAVTSDVIQIAERVNSSVDGADTAPQQTSVRIKVAPVPHRLDDTSYYSITFEPAGSELSGPSAANDGCRPVSHFEGGCGTPSIVSASEAAVVREPPADFDLEASVAFGEFLQSTDLAVVFLDRDLRIRQFTPAAARLFNLLPHDVGREIETFAGAFSRADLIDRINQVLHTGERDEFEVHHPRGRQYFLARLVPCGRGMTAPGIPLPDEAADDEISGAVLTLIDLSAFEQNHRQAHLLSSIVQSSADAIISRDCEGRIVTWNSAAEEMYGYSAAEAVGKPVSLIATQEEAVERENNLRVLRREKPSKQFDAARQTKSGEIRRVSVRLSPIFDDENRIVGVSTIERDISARAQMMERLTRSEKMLQTFYNHSPEMYCAFDAAGGRVTDCNDCMCRQLGRRREEILGCSILDFQTEPYRAKAAECLDRFRGSGMLHDEELELRRHDGSLLPVSLSATAIYDAEGRIVGGRGMWRDISVLRVKDELIRQGETRYHNSFQKSAIGIAHCDLSGRYLMANHRLCEIVGYSFEELALKTFAEITHPEDLAVETKIRERLIRGELDSYKLEKRYIDKSGRDVWVSVFVSLERDVDEKPMACHTYVEDISARKELEIELRSAIQQRDQFLAMLSHELRNPLGAILNTCAVLSRRRGGVKNVQNAVSIVNRQARQMAELLDDLLDVSRITTGKIKLEKVTVDLSEVVDQAVESQQSLAASRGQRVSVTYCDDPLPVFGDRSRLVQVVANLLNNAVKYTGDGGSVDVTLEKDGRIGRICVRDTGVGLESDQIESLFEMFAQKDATLDRSGGGMGLGLHLVRKLISFHSGRVFGRSDGLGRGSEFVVELPLSARKQAEPKVKRPPRRSRGQAVKKIVIIEDIDDARNMLVALLEADDYKVSAAADGEAGLEMILRERPDLAIVDIGLPKLDGYEVARRVRAKIPPSELRLIALTGYGQDSDHDMVMNAGFDTHLVKPLNHARLEKILAGR